MWIEIKIAITSLLVAIPFVSHMIYVHGSDKARYHSDTYWIPPFVVGLCLFIFLASCVATIWRI